MAKNFFRFVSKDLTLRASCVDATEAVRQMQIIQQACPLPTIAVGRTMVGALLLASHMKDKQSVGILVQGYGPLSRVYAEANPLGEVRGYSPNRYYEPETYPDHLTLKDSIGSGLLTVTRHLPRQKKPHQGTVQLVSGEIGDDIAHYLFQSDQVRSFISVGVHLDKNLQVAAAGGVLIEIMPGVEDEVAAKLEANVKATQTTDSVSRDLARGADIRDLAKPFLEGFDYMEIPHEGQAHYFCPCTKERVIRAFQILSIEDLTEMIEQDQRADAQCQMCGQPYEVTCEELEALRAEKIKTKMH